MRRRAFLAAVVVCVLAPAGVRAQAATAGATLTGHVTSNETGAPLPDVVVTLEGLRLSALTDSAGTYRIVGVPAGPQVMHLTLLGYAPVRQPVVVPTRGTVVQDVRMGVQALDVEGITVTADAVSRARGELGTSSVIGADAIKFQAATSLAGVLELVPGVPLTAPGLQGVQQFSLRVVRTSGATGGTSASDLASFGTAIILDGVPRSNNANLQTLGPRGEARFVSSAGGGIDLRGIPASTIERVEVIRGIPSARYGDLTQGAVLVDTRAGVVDPLVSGKLDARSAEATLVAGRRADWLHGTGTVVFDVARTRSAPGLSDDQSLRFAGQLSHRFEQEREGGGKLLLDTRLDVHGLTDDRPENPNVRPGDSEKSRDKGFSLSERASLDGADGSRLAFTGALGALGQWSFNRTPRVRATTPFTDRVEEGRAIGHFIGGQYESELTVDGRPWMAYARIEATEPGLGLGFHHTIRGGLELRREWNDGAGYQFDVEFPPQSRFNAVDGFDRPRRYDVIPPLVTTGLYVDDALRRDFGTQMALNVQAGLRLSLLHDGSTWVSGPREHALQPRLNVEFSLRPWLRLRGGWGRTAKVPSLADLFPAPQYYDVVNVNWFVADPAGRLAVLTTSIEDPTNPDLGMIRGEKAELGFELGLGRSVVSVVAFRDRIRGGVGISREPSLLLRDHYQLSDSSFDSGVPPEIIEPPSGADTVPILIDRPENNVAVRTHGVEVTAVLPEIKAIHTRFQVQGSWAHTERFQDALSFGPSDAITDFQLRSVRDRIPYWKGLKETGSRALATYRVIHQEPDAGLVITATVQHNISDRFQAVGATDTLSFAGYLTRDGRLVDVPAEERADPAYADLHESRSGVLSIPLSAPADWLLSVQVSKTLPLDGQLSFWAFNLLDRPGRYGDADSASRLYPQMRFGFELSMPARGLTPW